MPHHDPTTRTVTKEQCGLVFHDRDVTSLADDIIRVGDDAFRDACGRRGREAVEHRYNSETDERRLLAAIGRVTQPTHAKSTAEPLR